MRPDDPPVISGDASMLAALAGWKLEIPLEKSLADVFSEAAGR